MITKAQAYTPFTLTCATCGGKATAYPYPMPKGSIFCPACSPAWLESYLKFVLANPECTTTKTPFTITCANCGTQADTTIKVLYDSP